MTDGLHPIYGPNKLKLGHFGMNAAGIAMTRAPDYPKLSWQRTIEAARLAEEGNFEVIVPFARWKGFIEDDPVHQNGIVYDAYTFAAGVSQATEKSGVFVTSHIPTVHPILAAKQTATIDHISGGRFGLNVVAGWNRPELEMFGAAMREHDDRYDQADEWLMLLRRLWGEQEAFDHEGKFYTIRKGISLPRPLQGAMPPIMNAGGSGRGMHFAAKNADVAFVILKSDDPDQNAAQVAEYKDFARKEYGREIQVWSFGNVVQRPTTKEAEEFHDYYVNQWGDEECVDGWLKLQAMNTQVLPPHVLIALRERFKAGSGGIPLIGSAEVIADRLVKLSKVGLDGLLLSWFDCNAEMPAFNAEVMPLLRQAGVRVI
ncbi:LLM class flavin-dependent oxidoreductase [Azospirillum rugosum]|uniref:Alkanesulfonate monooxygenase SsuD/methylene tetrahydromethanopterin reductase-like flavin-dependent oxidoreductase (Luciferase family) n=1 Tax=Azospirillum rugosum TaxID=416170 RepID=A0ABS4SMM5_9PROT|nr:LLM class flavin-dependent oxidoreductase [Azospirillum rugosum]MBP2293333.1 alkanesulfonate monooxygenase SsuD/methylene tetrahydromethanopterin reductase-like flavin-dependent oxidoreductase (luciferase family) [Azospirillum rugosum]